MATAPQSRGPGSEEFQLTLMVSVNDDEGAVSPEALQRLALRVAKALELAAELLVSLEPRGWRARLSAEGGYVAAWLEKTSLRDTIHADLRELPGGLYTRLLDHLPILAKHESEIEELRPTDDGFEPYRARR